eukprot:8578226-Karenia_brevis.AAC.1
MHSAPGSSGNRDRRGRRIEQELLPTEAVAATEALASANDDEAPSTTCVVHWPDRAVKVMLSSPIEEETIASASGNHNGTGFAALGVAVQADHTDTLPNHMAMDAADLFIVDEDEGMEQQLTTTPGGGHGPPGDAGTEVRNGSLPLEWPAALPYPVENDRILVVKEPWISMILSGEKTMELRHIKLKEPWYWLARSGSGLIVGRAETGGSVLINSISKLHELEAEHR